MPSAPGACPLDSRGRTMSTASLPAPEGASSRATWPCTVGIQADYQNAWQIDLSYTTYMGASRYNLINDRDFIGGFVKYSF